MHLLISLLLFTLGSILALAEQGTLTTDPDETTLAPASLSGYSGPESLKEIKDEEVQLQESNQEEEKKEESEDNQTSHSDSD